MAVGWHSDTRRTVFTGMTKSDTKPAKTPKPAKLKNRTISALFKLLPDLKSKPTTESWDSGGFGQKRHNDLKSGIKALPGILGHF